MGVRAEQESLEDVAAPLAAEDGESGDGAGRDAARQPAGGVAGSPPAESAHGPTRAATPPDGIG
jgi:hypothetical protein